MSHEIPRHVSISRQNPRQKSHVSSQRVQFDVKFCVNLLVNVKCHVNATSKRRQISRQLRRQNFSSNNMQLHSHRSYSKEIYQTSLCVATCSVLSVETFRENAPYTFVFRFGELPSSILCAELKEYNLLTQRRTIYGALCRYVVQTHS